MDAEARHHLARAVDALAPEFSGVFAREAVHDCVMDSYERLQPVRLPGHVPLLAHRFARERLLAAARAQRPTTAGTPSVLFVCTRNAGRSQLAAALLADLVGDRVQVASAGSRPATQIATEIVTALHEVGLEVAALYPKPITDEVVRGADVVITMGCGDSCPVVPGRRYLDWDVLDPEGADEDTVRAIRDDLAQRVHRLAADLGVLARPRAAEDGVPTGGLSARKGCEQPVRGSSGLHPLPPCEHP